MTTTTTSGMRELDHRHSDIFQHPFAYADRGVPATSDSIAA